MRQARTTSLVLLGAFILSGCTQPNGRDVDMALKDLNVVDETNLNEMMLTAADPNEAVAYFERSSGNAPDRIEFRRGLAKSLTRAGRAVEAIGAWRHVLALPGRNNDDQVNLADAQIRAGDWPGARATLNSIPPTVETYGRYRLEALVADSEQDWAKADSFYATAAGLTTTPAGVINNWGFSHLTRGDFKKAEGLFLRAITHDSSMFTAKNNLALARGAQRRYDVPPVPLTQIERAQLLHTLALSAIRQGDVQTGKGLLRDALETHPQHFEAAARSLAALEDVG